MQEVLYFLRQRLDGTIAVAKFVDGHKEPSEIYYVSKKRCDCAGANQGRTCKHMIMSAQWKNDGSNPVAIDYDNNQTYPFGGVS